MDGSILSEAKLLEASRDFVCARLVTYESDEEGEFLASIGGSRKLEVANTTFVFLAPDGKTKLTNSGRSPRQAFTGTEEETLAGLLKAMKKISARYPGNGATANLRPVPYAVDVRRALNVAACDTQPLIIVSVKDDAKRKSIEETLAKLAWSEEFRGRFAFAKADNVADLKNIANTPKSDSVMIVQPGTYGLKGDLIAASRSLDATGLAKAMTRGLAVFNKEPMSRQQIRAGVRDGITWDAESIEFRKEKQQRSRGSRQGAGTSRNRGR